MSIKKHSIALITCHGWVGFSTSVINTARYWASKSYDVDLYVSSVHKSIPFPIFNERNIRRIRSNRARHKLFFLDDVLFYLFYYKKKYNYVIGFDARGLVRAFVSNIFQNATLIYHSLEFLEPVNNNFYSTLLKKSEIFCAKYATKVFTQDELRINYLLNDLKLPREKFDIVYNSPMGKVIKKKSYFFHDKFSINYSKKIVLATGSLIKEHCIKEIIESVINWDDLFVLVLHGVIPDKQFEIYIRRKISELPGKIFLSTELLDDSEKNIVFQSVDIGFVGFLPLNNNLKCSVGAAGKLFDFMQHGVPIIAYEALGIHDIIETNNMGFVFLTWNKLNFLLKEIIQNYNVYSENCNRLFDNYEFIKRYDTVIESISK